MLDLIRRSRETEAAPPEAVRAAREAFGWTHEQVADAMGVLPAEVAAWESGAITVAPYDAAMMRWHMELAAYDAALPRSQCCWIRANKERLERMARTGPRSAVGAIEEMVAHVRECAECTRAKALLRDVPPAPEPPLKPGFRGWRDAWYRRVDRLPAWLRVPLRTAESLLWLGVVYLGIELLDFVAEPSEGFHLSLAVFLGWFAGITWFMFLSNLLQPVSDRHPYVGGQLVGAGVAIPANLVLGLFGITNPAHAGSWALPLIIGAAAGWILGQSEQEGQEAEARALDPSRAAGDTEEERVVYIRQRDTSWRADAQTRPSVMRVGEVRAGGDPPAAGE